MSPEEMSPEEIVNGKRLKPSDFGLSPFGLPSDFGLSPFRLPSDFGLIPFGLPSDSGLSPFGLTEIVFFSYYPSKNE